jgi:hypothetical protein
MPTEETGEGLDGADGDVSLEEECRVLFTEADEAKARLMGLAGKESPELARLYREVAGTVVSLVSDLAATMGAGFAELGGEIDRLEAEQEGEVVESVLLDEDGKLYVAYFEQVLTLLDGLKDAVPAGSEQAEALAALRRMTEERLEFTREIMVEEGEPDEPDPEPQ